MVERWDSGSDSDENWVLQHSAMRNDGKFRWSTSSAARNLTDLIVYYGHIRQCNDLKHQFLNIRTGETIDPCPT